MPTIRQMALLGGSAIAANDGRNGLAPPAAGLALWLKANAISGSDGATVNTWPDSSGNGNDANAPIVIGPGPVLKTAIVHGHAVVRFDGIDASFELPDFASGFSQGEGLCVCKNADLGGVGGLWYFGAPGNANHVPYLDGNIYDGWGSTARKSAGNPTPDLGQWTLYDVASSSSEWTARVNDSVLFTTASNTVAFPAVPTIGTSSLAQYYPGDIAEVLVYDHVLSSGERAAVVAYLIDKYALVF